MKKEKNKCRVCGENTQLTWRVWNWSDDYSDKLFENKKKALAYYNKKYSESPLLGWRLYEHIYCSKCEEDIENCIKNGEEND